MSIHSSNERSAIYGGLVQANLQIFTALFSKSHAIVKMELHCQIGIVLRKKGGSDLFRFFVKFFCKYNTFSERRYNTGMFSKIIVFWSAVQSVVLSTKVT